MGVADHKEAAADLRATVHIVVVSSTRSEKTDESGLLLTELLEQAGHRVVGRHVIPDDARRIRRVLGELAADGESNVVILTGGTGVSRRDVTPDAVEPLLDAPIPGFGELFRMLSFEEVGSAAMLSRATAGMMGPLVVFAVPGSPKACRLALERLILPELPHLLREVRKEGPPEPPVDFDDYEFETEEIEQEDPVSEEEAKPESPPPPTGTLGRLGGGKMEIKSEEVVHEVGVDTGSAEDRPIPPSGWRRAVYEIEGELDRTKREELPWELEKISPVIDVLHSAGEAAVLKVQGRKYGIYGWPDLRRDHSKVIAIGWGQPIAEVLVLHRYPMLTGVCVEEDHGLLPTRHADVAEVAESVTGRAPKDTTGELFAVQGDAIWIQRGGSVIRWDGRKEFNDGTPSQVLSTLLLHWSNK